MKNLLTLFTLLCLLLATGKLISGQKCGCKRNQCCSKFGFCGNDDAHCGSNCWAGPCKRRNKVKVGDIASNGFFNGIVASQGRRGCPGKGFYSRARFLLAMASYPTFGTIGSVDDSKREIAAFFAHVAHETGRLCFIEEKGGQSKPYCDPTYSQWPCAANKHYYGRGPLKLTWNYNYGAVGRAIGFNGLTNPELVAKNALISIKASVWFWMENCHGPFVSGKGFGSTIRAINSAECNGKRPAEVSSRVKYYQDYYMCYIEEIDGPSKDYCDETNTQYPCNPSKGYYGRGPIQLSWNFNYGPAGVSIGFDGINNPEAVATDRVVSFRTALWYWMNNCHDLIVSGQGFGATIRAINGRLECDGGYAATVTARVGYYTDYCNQLQVDPGTNLRC